MERKTTAASLGVKRVWPYLKLFSEEFRTELPASGPSVPVSVRKFLKYKYIFPSMRNSASVFKILPCAEF